MNDSCDLAFCPYLKLWGQFYDPLWVRFSFIVLLFLQIELWNVLVTENQGMGFKKTTTKKQTKNYSSTR